MFRTLRSKLTFSYLAVALLCLLLAMGGMFALARDYAQRTGFRTLEEKWSLAMPLVRVAANTEARRDTVLSRAILGSVQDAIRNANVRALLLDPATLQVVEDTSTRFNATGQRIDFGLDDAELQDRLLSDEGVRGTHRFEGELESIQYIARRIRPLRLANLDMANAGPPAQASPVPYIVVLAQPVPRIFTGLIGDLRDALVPAIALAVVVALVVAFLLARSISRPISKLAVASAALAKGDYSQRIEVDGQDEVATLTAQFNEMAAEVGRAHQMQRDFIANVSHDLKTPLTSIQGFSQAILDGAVRDDAGYRQAAGIINTEAQRMTRLVAELLTLARLESGLHSLELHPVDLGEALTQLALAMQPQAREAGVTLSARLLVQQAPVLADADKIKQALGNLVDNALKHTPAGGKVTLEMSRIPGGVLVKVVDTGKGISPEELPRVMERFYQIDKARSTGGLPNADERRIGLGLAIAREIVNAHRGGITIESTMGVGTTVLVSLPAEPAKSDTQSDQKGAERIAAGQEPVEPLLPAGRTEQ
jgi:signal transduction histidine kinase